MQTENDSADFDPNASLGPADLEEKHQDTEEDAEEFSLDELRKVYAKVIQEQRTSEHEQPISSEKDSELNTNANEAEDRLKANRQDNQTASNPSPAISKTLDFDDDDSQVPVTPQSIVEAILFVGDPTGKKLTLKRIASVLRDVSPKEVKQIILQLNQQYQEEKAAYRIFLDKDRVEMRLDESLHEFQSTFTGRNRSIKLTPAAIEILAIVAYNQPIGRSRIDELRKKPSQSLLKQLEKFGLIETVEGISETSVEKSARGLGEKPNGKSAEKITREQKWGTTPKFLAIFNLADPDELPRSQHFDDLDELLA